MMPTAARSLTLPPGFRYSSLAYTSADPGGTSFLKWRMGVSPTNCVMSSATRRREPSSVFIRTLQSTEAEAQRQLHFHNLTIHCDGMDQIAILVQPARSPLLARVVPAPGADGELAISVGSGIHMDAPVTARTLRIGGLVANRVLIANVMGYGSADGIYFIQSFGEERNPSGPLGHGLQSPMCAPLFFISKQANGVYGGPVLLL